ncbi:MAG: DUF721 domain-containing protein [Syntrophales bacterium]|jgi:hypothetical protein|nr:DUF721 domain-containing protein [Syntrophales bacterium]
MARRRGARHPQQVGDVLARVLKKAGMRLPVQDNRLKEAWNSAVGVMIAAQTHPDRIRDGTLFLKVSTSVWMHQLQFLKQDILEKFQKRWQAEPVHRLHFSVGKWAGASTAGQEKTFFQPTATLLKKRDRKMIEESLVEVRDQELQIVLRRAMLKELARRRYLEHHRRGPV